MREWLIIAVGLVIGLTIGILIGETFELSRIVAKIVGIGSAPMAGWVKPLSDNT